MNEEKLLAELKSGKIRSVYYLYGKETFLVKTYTERIAGKCLSDSERDFNLVRFCGNPDLQTVAESVQTLPVFAQKRVVMLNDLDAEKLGEDGTLEDLLTIIAGVPEETCMIIFCTGFVPDIKKSKTKKLIAAIEKAGAAVGFDKMSESKTADLIAKRVSRSGCTISRDNAIHLARLCLRNLTLIACEIDKLCAYANYCGEITRKSLEMLTARQLESGVFALAGEITAKRGANSMKLLEELIEQGNHPVVIMSSLSMTFIDFYRAKIGSNSGRQAQQILKDFGYAANRSWVMGKAISASARMTVTQARECVRVLCDADYKLKSSPVEDRIIMERAIAELLSLC
jgi:DNA polymerase-3 subunit delta